MTRCFGRLYLSRQQIVNLGLLSKLFVWGVGLEVGVQPIRKENEFRDENVFLNFDS